MTIPAILVSISGEPKSGKTHLALTFPKPLSIISLDLGAKALLANPFFKGQDITLREMPMPLFDSLDGVGLGFSNFWQEVKKQIYADIDGCKFQTIVIDTATALWEVIRYGFNEEEGKSIGASSKARNYGEPNARMYGIYTRAQVGGVNLVLTQYVKDKWEDDKNTGRRVLDGWNRTEGLVDINLLNKKEPNPKGKGSQFRTTIKDNRFDHTTEGTELLMTDYDELITIMGL
uniref:Putative ATPase domain containing protein n=1 Tax=viral metagenome TaxID=1070528 RepID=A0A6M3IQ34_9ZZZZ